LPDDIHQALRIRAAKRGHSTADEVREILRSAVKLGNPLRMGDALSALSRDIGLRNADFDVFDQARVASPVSPLALD